MLDTRQAPPFCVPLRFFLTAPLFGMAGAGLLLAYGSEALLTRWSPLTLAILHCFTAGLMLQAMLGSLFQVLPVAAGCTVPDALRVAGIVHVTTAAGAVALCSGFLLPGHHLLSLGGGLLAMGCTVFVVAAGIGLWRAKPRNPVSLLLRQAVAGLAVTVGLGLTLALQMDHGAGPRFFVLFNLHGLWGFAGWALPLVAAVASLVVPMFYMSPRYPETRVHQAGWIGIVALWVASGMAAADFADGSAVAAALLVMLAACFGVLTLDIFRRRKRPRSDATCHGWRGAMSFLVLASLLLLVRLALPPSPASGTLEVAIGITAALGAFTGLIGAMQLKILPFLATLHLSPLGIWQLEGEPGEGIQTAQVLLHTLAVISLLAALVAPVLTRPAAMLLFAAQSIYASNVWRLALAYRRTRRTAATRPSDRLKA